MSPNKSLRRFEVTYVSADADAECRVSNAAWWHQWGIIRYSVSHSHSYIYGLITIQWNVWNAGQKTELIYFANWIPGPWSKCGKTCGLLDF